MDLHKNQMLANDIGQIIPNLESIHHHNLTGSQYKAFMVFKLCEFLRCLMTQWQTQLTFACQWKRNDI